MRELVVSSDAQFAATKAFRLPPVEQVRASIWAVPIAMPGHFLPYSLSYLIRDAVGDLHVVDPGYDSDANWAALQAAWTAVGGASVRIASVIVTHLHPDHLGLASRVRDRTGSPIVMHEREQAAARSMHRAAAPDFDRWGVPSARQPELAAMAANRDSRPPVDADVVVQGDRASLTVPGVDVTAIRTPGHTPGHICLHVPADGVLLTGDHVLPNVVPGLGLGGPTATSPIADYLQGLRDVERFADDEVLPGHGYRFRPIGARTAVIEAHHRRRSAEVAAALANGDDPTVWEVARSLTWSAGWDALAGFTLFSALLQTEMHRDFLTRSTGGAADVDWSPQAHAG